MHCPLNLPQALAAVGLTASASSGPAAIERAAIDAATGGAQRGDIIVTEIMANPAAVGNAGGEWFEVRNVSDGSVSISGYEIRDDGSDLFVIPDLPPIPPHGHVVFGRSDDPEVNGGAPVDVAYGTAIILANTADEIRLLDGAVIVDEVRYDQSFPSEAGAAMSLDSGSLDAISNDDAAHWCAAATPYGAGDLGTPGAPNPPCDGTACVADLDGSGAVDVQDLLALLIAWTDADPRGDLDGDGVVGTGDLLLLLATWGTCAP